MVWLTTPPWGRWIATLLIVVGALWVEFRPDATALHPFATADIAAGEEYGAWNTRLREIPIDLLAPIAHEGIAGRPYVEDEPIISVLLSPTEKGYPDDWWLVEVELQAGARTGDEAMIVLAGSDGEIQGIVVRPAEDGTFGSGLGQIALSRADAVAVARAHTAGNLAVLIRPAVRLP